MNARDQKCSKIVLKWKIKYSPILRQLQQLVLHILDPFMVFSKLIMIRNRTEITILILDLYLDPFSLTQNEPFLMKTHFWHFRRGKIFWNFEMKFWNEFFEVKFLGWKWDEKFSLASSSVLLSSILLTHSWSISLTAPSIFCWAEPRLAGKSANERWKQAICWWPKNTGQMTFNVVKMRSIGVKQIVVRVKVIKIFLKFLFFIFKVFTESRNNFT